MSGIARGAGFSVAPAGVRAGRLVPRAGLFDRLDRSARVTLVSAPAGSGKSSLVRGWILEAGLVGRVAWVQVATVEPDPIGFWLSVVDAIRATEVGVGTVGELTPAPGLDAGVVSERLLADLSSLEQPVWLVIDDLQELCSSEALRPLELFLMRAPRVVRFVLVTRPGVRLGLHRLRLEEGLTEVRAEDLRFSLEESRALFDGAGVQLSDTGLAQLVERTEGWVAGLRLAALSLAGHPDPERFAAEFAGSDSTVAEYLLAEVLERQPEEVRSLLVRTSVLERVSGPLADLLTGRGDGQRILQELEDAGAFVVSLDASRAWFRYHPLFADMLRMELQRAGSDERQRLHGLAAGWFADHGNPIDAIAHAQLAQEWAWAARLLLDSWFGLVLSGQSARAHELLRGFPAGVVGANGELLSLTAAYEASRGSAEAAQLALARASARGVDPDREAQVELVAAIVRLSLARYRGDLPAVVEQAHRVLVPAEAPHPFLGDEVRAFALLEFGVGELWTGRFEAAATHLEHALALARRAGRPFLELGALAHLAQIDIFESIRLGEQRSGEAIELAERHGWQDDPVAGVGFAVHGIALAVQGRLADAESCLQHAERSRLAWVSPAGGLMLCVMRGLVEAARGRDSEALRAFREADRLRESLVGPHVLAARIPGHLVRTLARLGEVARAEAVLAGLTETESALPEVRIARAALHLASDDHEGAPSVLAPLLAGPALMMRPQVWPVQALVLEALARDAVGDIAASDRALEHALALAEPEGLRIAFLLYPAPGLLERHRRGRTSHPALIAEILDLLAGRSPAARSGAPRFDLGPLSESETRVRYLPTNLSGPEIARELNVSLNTIRTHMRHLYAKLGVHTRADAVERARTLRLLAPSSRAG